MGFKNTIKHPYTSIGGKIVGQGQLDQQEAMHFYPLSTLELFKLSFLIPNLTVEHSYTLYTWLHKMQLEMDILILYTTLV